MFLQRLATGETGVKQARYRRRPTRGSEALYAHAQYNTQPVGIEGPWHLLFNAWCNEFPPRVLHFSAFILTWSECVSVCACRARLWVHVWEYVRVCVCVYMGALMCVCVCAWWSMCAPALSLLSPLSNCVSYAPYH